jgi:hypothetical protein
VDIPETNEVITNALHGTTQWAANSILKNGFLPSSGREYYLGDGVYFVEGQLYSAIYFAKRTARGRPIAVISATVHLGRCLDIHDPAYKELIDEACDQMSRLRRLAPNEPEGHQVLNHLARVLKLDTVRGVHSAGPSMFENTNFRHRVEKIICVKNIAKIGNVARVSL